MSNNLALIASITCMLATIINAINIARGWHTESRSSLWLMGCLIILAIVQIVLIVQIVFRR